MNNFLFIKQEQEEKESIPKVPSREPQNTPQRISREEIEKFDENTREIDKLKEIIEKKSKESEEDSN